MPQFRCPRCKKKFKNQATVLKHMNQPRSWCRTRYEYLLAISLLKQQPTQQQPISTNPSDPAHLSDVFSNPPNSMYDHVPENEVDVTMDDFSNTSLPDPWRNESNHKPYHITEHLGASHIFGMGQTFMDKFDSDQYAPRREQNLYYPFASRDEWEFASYLLRSSLSMGAVDQLLRLELVKGLGLSFRTAKDLRSRAEILPGGPQWKSKAWKTVYPTKKKIALYYRDPLECIQSLLHSPLIKDHVKFKPFQIFRTAEKVMRVYTEWLSGEAAWNIQSQIPAGATALGTILSSDKTNISAMTGNREAHPLLISLANLDMDFRMKVSNHAFLLLAILPIPKFIHRNKRLRGVLADRVFHECLDFVTKPLKIAAQIGIMMSDPLGGQRLCYTPLAGYIVDTPESALIAGVGGKTSSVTMASYKQFGDSFRHEPRTASTTIAQLHSLEEKVDPWDLQAYFKAAKETFRLNGVHRPFWRDWPLSDPSDFLTPEPLHHWHKQFWDHDAKWCIKAVGDAEIDFRFSVLHPHTGFRHFKEGISALKQVTGREHRDVQRYIIPVIADAVPKDFLIAVRALMDFRYLAQAPEIDDALCAQIESALQEFHAHKDAILVAKARCGEKGIPIENWHIPKLEFLQSVVRSICTSGVPIQWSADRTENAHITELKVPARSGNNQNYEPQICRYLDRADKCRVFNLATAVRDAGFDFRARFGNHVDDDDDAASTTSNDSEGLGETQEFTKTSTILENLDPVFPLTGTTRNAVNYFVRADSVSKHPYPTMPTPLRTFVTPQVAIHLKRDPKFKRMLVDDAAQLFNLPDFRPALHDYITKMETNSSSRISSIGGRRFATKDSTLPFTHVEIWTKLQVQSKAYHHPHNVLPPQTVNAAPPSTKWPLGQYDTVIANTEPAREWPFSGMSGHHVVQLRIIFRIAPPSGWQHPLKLDRFLAYVQRFDIVPQVNQKVTDSPTLRGLYPEPLAGMYIVKRARRTNKDAMGDIIPLDQLRALVELTPQFGKKADRRFEKTNNLEYGTEYWVDKYFDKELFFALNNIKA
ncbi:hypothetical protein BDZ97DRAFT_1914618 [Flammula alnicola]|nr:hypothetical protein BDZ97DRAFT_1914618 [Flammula alnicola]